jgi:hypothetical protein
MTCVLVVALLFPVPSLSGRTSVRDVPWLSAMSGRLPVSLISRDTLHRSTPVFASTVFRRPHALDATSLCSKFTTPIARDSSFLEVVCWKIISRASE